MQKTSKWLLMLALAVITAISFSSCSKDDDGGEPNGPDIPGNVTTLPNKVKAIKTTTSHYTQQVSFSYDNSGRVSNYTFSTLAEGKESRNSVNLTYSANSIKVEEEAEEGMNYVLSLQDNKVVSYSGKNTEGNNESGTMIYDGNNQMIKSTSVSKVYPSGITCEYTWSNGNITSIKETEGSNKPSITNLGYGSVKNTMNIDIMGFGASLVKGAAGIAMLLGFGGQRTANLPSKYNNAETMNYTVNGDGYVTKITEGNITLDIIY